MFQEILIGMLSGISYGLLGYLKSKEKFNSKKFLKAIIIGAIAGAYASYAKININEAITFLSSAGITALVDFIIIAITKRIKLR